MSVVVTRIYDDRITIASDSIRVRYGTTQEKLKFGKLFRVKDVIVGGCGYSEETGLFRLFLDTHVPKAATEDAILELMSEFHDWVRKKVDSGNRYTFSNDYHLVFGGKAFYVSGYHIARIEDYHAIGAGMDFALAALYLGHDPKKAVEAACELSVYCEAPVNVFNLYLKD